MRSLNLILGLTLALILGCASKPKHNATISETANPTEEISVVEQELDQLKNSSADVLAPKALKQSEKAYVKAKELHADQKPKEEIFKQLALAKGWNQDAMSQIEKSGPALQSVLEIRRFADTAQAPTVFPTRWKDSEIDLQRTARALESGRPSGIDIKIDQLKRAYLQLESDAAVEVALGDLRKDVQDTRQAGSEFLAPKTLREAQLQLDRSTMAIKGSPRNQTVLRQSRQQAESAVYRLISVTRQAQMQRGQTTEDQVLALMIEDSRIDRADRVREQNSEEARAAALEEVMSTHKKDLQKQRRQIQELQQNRDMPIDPE